MKPPAGVARAVWQQMPVAKQRLYVDGPPYSGHDALRMAVIVFAAELASHGIPEETALVLCLEMPFVAGRTSEAAVRKQIPAFVKWAYKPPDGLPILTGCPRASERYGTTDSARGRLKAVFEPYCDDACFPCPIFRHRGAPELSITRSRYEPLLLSPIWMSARQSGLGGETRVVWMTLAALAADSGQEVIEASSNFISHRLGGTIAPRTVRFHLGRLRQHGLMETVNKRRGWHRVRPLEGDALAQLEAKLGVREAAKWNRVEASWDSLRKAIGAPKWDVGELTCEATETATDCRKNS